MKQISLFISMALLILGTFAWAENSDPNPTGAGVVTVGNKVTDVCDCNASSAPLLPKEQYNKLLPDGEAGEAAKTNPGASGTGTN